MAQHRLWKHDRGSVVVLPLFLALLGVAEHGKHRVSVSKPVKQ